VAVLERARGGETERERERERDEAIEATDLKKRSNGANEENGSFVRATGCSPHRVRRAPAAGAAGVLMVDATPV
jgi:hypothetical protein